MNVYRLTSPNCDQTEIVVEHVVLHYTAVDLQGTLDIFMHRDNGVSAHLVIDTDGAIYELVKCLEGKAWRAWHAGVSYYGDKKAFNDHSVGIELVNLNGNLFSYTDAQYDALQHVVQTLKQHYPRLADPERVVGHEHIAGFRGKVDPGMLFDWPRFYRRCYPEVTAPERKAVLPDELHQALMPLAETVSAETKESARYWQAVSSLTESVVKLLKE
ncbi:N-acetylmuramoyl-L-alanine amidase [Endozoicomonas montiporae]|uniref:N-acetylmuramoyl-L-alanine amidase n=2 Tax=Endozoicomonas montiporae TaxID=1027273 RepID=A0A081N1S2_9GAMM|nr:N-acetylmuramoyl-L-alanine amidase [Endozoicomonas montiporae]AMO58663.1 putative N-acetylmuramoyl-L-alanine amidase [Endozoicomonas montiporae CL-33]KEQ12395.1 N-acetylmuramoyl-L-alanine amidase [Endozoicomonas montiporae]